MEKLDISAVVTAIDGVTLSLSHSALILMMRDSPVSWKMKWKRLNLLIERETNVHQECSVKLLNISPNRFGIMGHCASHKILGGNWSSSGWHDALWGNGYIKWVQDAEKNGLKKWVMGCSGKMDHKMGLGKWVT